MKTSPSGDMLCCVQVLEISTTVAGAYCGFILAALGAQVNRVELPTEINAPADVARLAALALHRGKAAIAPAAIAAHAARADLVIVEAVAACREQVERLLAREGLPPRCQVIYVGREGSGRDLHGLSASITAAARSGISVAMGEREGAPLMLPCDFAEYQAGVYAAGAALACLLRRGDAFDAVEVNSVDVLGAFVGALAHNFVPYGRPWHRDGRRPSMSGGVYPCGLFPCADGYVAIYCRGTKEWHGLLEAMGNPDWSLGEEARDPRWVAAHAADAMDLRLNAWLAGFTRHDLMDLGMVFGFPASPVRYPEETLEDAQFAYREALVPLVDPADGRTLRVPTVPWRILAEPAGPPPRTASAARPARSASPAHLFEGLRVLDLTWVWSGPLVTSALADLGAEVIKVEHGSHLDSLRLRGAATASGGQGPAMERNPWFNQVNHGKKSWELDIGSQEGRRQLLEMVRGCDIVVENMRPGALRNNGLGYAELAAVNPSLLMLSMSMAGQSGPMALMKGYAGLMSSLAGLEAVTGYASEQPHAAFVGMTMPALGDPNAAGHGLAVLLAALYRRRLTGQGAWIDLSQTDAILAAMAGPVIEGQLRGFVPVRGNGDCNRFPQGNFRCAGQDAWVALSVADDAMWRRLADVCGPALRDFAELDLEGRLARRDALLPALERWLAVRTPGEVCAALEAARVVCAEVATYAAMLASDERRGRGLSAVVGHPFIGAQEVFFVPWRFQGEPAGAARGAPLFGEHSAECLAGLADARSPILSA